MKLISTNQQRAVALLEKTDKKNRIQVLLLQAGIIKILSSTGFPVFSTHCNQGIFNFNLDTLPADTYTLLIGATHIML